ncbi:MAG: S1/P1 Nuclease, partial [Bacteroidetes bacterium]|nr:S1/P1 Nuclease [Bacteroidota bacterium]
YAGKARYIENPLNEAFKICRASFKEVDSVLRLQRMVDKNFPREKRYETVRRNGKNMQDYSEAYTKAYNATLKGMVERRLRASIAEIGSYWYSAWVDAGQPDLNKLIAHRMTRVQRTSIKEEEALYQKGKVLVLGRH